MTIHFSCPQCNKAIAVRDEFAGKRGKCPGCQQVVVIPAPSAAVTGSPPAKAPAAKGNVSPVNKARTVAEVGTSTVARNAMVPPADGGKSAAAAVVSSPPLNAAQRREQILNAVQGELEPQKITFFSRLRLCCAALFCLNVAAVPWLAIVAVLSGCAFWGLATGAIVPAAIVGSVVSLFLLRPLVCGPKPAKANFVSQANEPLLWAFIERISDALQSPRPKSVAIDCSLDARSSGPGLFGGSVQVVFGLPLAGTLNLSQFAGVISHELAYYRQGTGAGCKVTMRSIHNWLAEMSFEPDALDQAIARQGKVVRLLFLPIAAGDWLVRKFLWLNFELVHLVAGGTLKQQEQAADAWASTLAGSAPFAATRGQICLLNYAWQAAQADLSMLLKERQLGDNLVAVINNNLNDTPEEVREFIVEQAAAEVRRSYDLRASDALRIAAAKKLGAAGMMSCQFPATTLFTDFVKTAKSVTWEYYRAKYGKLVRQHELRVT